MRGAAALALMLCCAAAGCGGGAPTDPESAIEVFGPYRGVEADRLMETIAPFVRESGVDVRYVGSLDFVDDLTLRVGAGADPPDIAIVPQPGLITELADDGRIVPTAPAVGAAIAANYPPAAAALGRHDDRRYAVPFRLVVKSLVWYRPDVFAEHGWSVPSTLAELEALADRVETQSDLAPWCFAMAAGSATGWAATDWVEDLVLRGAGLKRYRRWTAGAVEFAAPAIESAFERFRTLVLDAGRLAGGVSGAVETPVDEAFAPLLADPPGCALYKQADFAVGWMPEGTTVGRDADVDWFLLPPESASKPAPVLVGGDQAVQFRRDRGVDALMAYLAGPDAGASWARRGGFLSPKSSIAEQDYPAGYRRGLAARVGDASELAFDASDQMPPEIGSGLLWDGITDWVAGVDDYDAFARRIDAARARESAGSR